MQAKAVVVLLFLGAVSVAYGQQQYCMPIANATNSVCGTLPATTCTSTATAVDGNQYSLAAYTIQVNNWNSQKSALCPQQPSLVDDYPLQEFCPDLCTSNYTCTANTNPVGNLGPMCWHLCLICFTQAQCTAWSQNPGNVTRSGTPEVGCYSSWTHRAVDPLQINDVTPTWGYLKGNQKIVITGCGFDTYSEATCVWGNKHSVNALIVNDNTIHCWTPKMSFVTIPTTTTFMIIFDGTPAIQRSLPDFWWGPMITNVAPTQVYVAPTSPLTITGFGFSEWSGNTTVGIDGVNCTSVALTDTTITCTLPTGTINQNALVDVYFSGVKYNYIHSYPWTVHYGPIITGINPTCGHVQGGDTVTITGSLFDDKVLQNPRVEFNINGVWWYGLNAQQVGASVTFVTPNATATMDLWDYTATLYLFGQTPSFSKVPVPGSATFHYGALLFTVTPTVGYIDGGDVVSITGCAFKDYNVSTINVVAGTAPLCAANTITIVNDNLITCTSAASTACYSQPAVTVTLPLSRSLPTPTQQPSTYSNLWWWGPLLSVNTLTPTRGPWSVSSTATVSGFKIGRSASTTFATNGCNFNTGLGLKNGTLVLQSSILCTVPPNAWNVEGPVNYGFDSPCTNYPTATPKYHWGPLCTGVSPTFGYIGGGVSVTLIGQGFQDGDWTNKVIRPSFCVAGIGGGCNWEQYGANVTVSSTTAAVTTTPNFALAPRNGFGANRGFGSTATVNLFFDIQAKNESYALPCGTYRYGPIVTSTNPRKGPIGPRAVHSPNTQVTVSGVGFADPLVTNNLRVAFGPIHGESAVASGDTSLTVLTLWGARANTDKSVYVYFDTCNTTVSSTIFTWGPQINGSYPIYGYNQGLLGGTNTVITITGQRFDEWLYNGAYTDAICVIDNAYGTATTIVNAQTITCTVPNRPFGTQGVVQVVFGRTCRGDWDWSQVVQSPNDVFYRPQITGITPTAGWISGAQTVTISGLGLGGWPSYNCFFGQYLGSPLSNPTFLNDNVVCKTPTRRADFNSDVLVHVQLVDLPVTFNQGLTYKVWGPTYHYGPICGAVTPSRGYLAPVSSFAVTLSGLNFADNIFFNNTSPVVLFNGLNVTVQAGSTDNAVVVNNLPQNSCLQNDTITMYWDRTTQVITCPVFTHGPIVVSSTPNLGWQGTSVTVSGNLFDDPLLYAALADVKVVFGAAIGTTVSVTTNTIVATAPANAWLFDPNVVVRWQSATVNKTCVADAVLVANDFHYGPIITSITPTFGYVLGGYPVTIAGTGFTCCGFTNGPTNCRFARNDLPTADVVAGATDSQVICKSQVRNSEVTSPATATTLKAVGLRFNATAANLVIDTDTTPALPRQPLVTYYYGPLVNSVTPTFGRIRGGTTLTIAGAGFSDPWFTNLALGSLNPGCRFSSTAGTWNINSTSWTDSAVVCNTLDYIHKCGDPLDVITLVFYANSSVTDRFITPTDNRLTHKYGPLISSVSASWGYVKGGDSITINLSETDEWSGLKAKVLFANREIEGTTYAVSNTLNVLTPRGAFLHSGNVSVILDPKNDGLTTLSYYWHWTPFTTSISQAWGIESGGFSTTIYGGGFCEYELVTCAFGTSGAFQSDIAQDDKVVCQVPGNPPSTVAVSLTFCDYWNDCWEIYANSPDTIPAPSFTHVGITSVAPVSGPWVGGTTVTIQGSGFDQFSAISVSFGSLTPVSPVGNSSTATQFTVVTPASPNAQTVQIFVTLTYSFSTGETIQYTIPGNPSTPFNFRYGYPAITSISPATTDVDIGTDVTLTGDYFNGGALSNIKCTFTVPSSTGTTALTVNAKAKTDTTVTCGSPSYTTGVTIFGPSTVTVSFDGNRQSNIVPFIYSQTAAITGISPTTGPQYGATSVTIFGNNFNAGISILAKFDTVVTNIVSVQYNVNNGTTTGSGTTTTTTGGTTTGGKNGTAVNSAYKSRGVRGANDIIVVYSPRSLANNFPASAKVEISLDGGLTWTNTQNGASMFQYQSGFTSTSAQATQGATSSTSMANALVPLVSMVFALVLFVMAF